jgi:hypothetical protein
VRRLPALLAAAALVTVLASSLTACSGTPGFGGCEPVYQPGEASELVTATGSGKTSPPKVDFPTPLIAETPQVSVLIEGEGDPTPQGGIVDVRLSVFDGETGTNIGSSYASDAGYFRYTAGGDDRALVRAVQCARLGERLVLTATARETLGDDAVDDPDTNIDPKSTLVLVYDIIATYLGKADGVNQLPQDGMPTVVTAPDGQPGITVPGGDAPTETRVATIKAGGGATVDDGDTAVLHFSAWSWPAEGDRPADVDSSWARSPIDQVIAEDGSGDGSERIAPGVAAKLAGVKVGSQVLVVIPADEAYPDGVPSSIDPDSTLIYVIDVLGIKK